MTMTRIFLPQHLLLVVLLSLVEGFGGVAFVVLPPTPTRTRTSSSSCLFSSSLYDRIGGKPAVDAAVNEFYDRVVSDPNLSRFFDVNTDLGALKKHQRIFLTYAFGGASDAEFIHMKMKQGIHMTDTMQEQEVQSENDVDVMGYVHESHKRLLDDMGLNGDHFDMVAGHLIGTLQHLGVDPPLIDEAVEIVGPLRAAFE